MVFTGSSNRNLSEAEFSECVANESTSIGLRRTRSAAARNVCADSFSASTTALFTACAVSFNERSASFNNASVIPQLVRGAQVDDIVPILQSLQIVVGDLAK